VIQSPRSSILAVRSSTDFKPTGQFRLYFDNPMIPIFYSQYSGKSLMTFEAPEKAVKKSKQSIAKICLDNNITEPVVVDTKMTGVMELFENLPPLGLNPRFGLNYKFVHEDTEENSNNWHQIIVFIKNTKGYKDLIKIHNSANLEYSGRITPAVLNKYWTENLKLAIPFYDSYLFRNTLYDVACLPEFENIPHTFFIEENGLPFDDLVNSKIKGNKMLVKSIFYEKEKDFVTWLTYRCALNFSNKGKNRTLEDPMFDHCHSNKFSFESYLKYILKEQTK